MRNNVFKTAAHCITTNVLLLTSLTCSAQSVPTDHADQTWMCVLDLQTGQSQRLFVIEQLTSVGSPTLSPDGGKIAFDGTADGQSISPDAHIFICNIDGSNLEDLGPGTMPSWSPRGFRLAFSRSTPEHGVWLMNVDGQNIQLIDQQGWSVQWSPNGRMLAYTRRVGGTADFVIYNLVEDEFSSVFHGKNEDYDSFHRNFAWSPNCKKLCFKATTLHQKTHLCSVGINGDPVVSVHHICDSAFADFTWLNNDTIGTCMKSATQKCNQLFTIDASPSINTAERSPTETVGQFSGRNNSDGDVSRDGRLMVYISRPHKI